MSKKRWTEADVYRLLEKRFPAPAFAILPQVRNGTGFARARARTADALAISCYPSRGLYATGVEIKVSTSDWRKELANPHKAGDIQKFCRYWYVAAPAGVVPVGEVPDAWGLIECHANRTVETKAAPRLEDEQPPDWLFAASVIRSAASCMVTRDEMQRQLDAAFEKSREAISDAAKLKPTQHHLEKLQSSVAKFEAASGIQITTFNGESVGKAAKIAMACGAPGVIQRATSLKETAARFADEMSHILDKYAHDEATQEKHG